MQISNLVHDIHIKLRKLQQKSIKSNNVTYLSNICHTNYCYTTAATSGAGTDYPSGTPPSLVGFVFLDLQFYVYVLQIVVCPFVLFLLAIVLSVLLRYTDSDYPFGIFKLFLQRVSPNFTPFFTTVPFPGGCRGVNGAQEISAIDPNDIRFV